MPWRDNDQKRAYDREFARRPETRERRRETHKIWLDNNRERKIANEARRRMEKRAQVLVATTRTRARLRGLEFDLDQHVAEIQRRIDAGSCEVSGWPFDLGPGRTFDSPSIDRIDPRQGYTIGNIRIVLNLVNAALGDWGEAILREVMTKWLR